MEKEIEEAKWRSMEALMDDLIDNPDKYPDKMVVLSLTDEELGKIFTKERLRIVREVREKQPKSMRELARMLERDISVVARDLKILEDYDIIGLEKAGKEAKPVVKKDVLVLPLMPLKPKTLEEVVA